jgi:hypothetical protein
MYVMYAQNDIHSSAVKTLPSCIQLFVVRRRLPPWFVFSTKEKTKFLKHAKNTKSARKNHLHGTQAKRQRKKNPL